jgi:hypothetical protein
VNEYFTNVVVIAAVDDDDAAVIVVDVDVAAAVVVVFVFVVVEHYAASSDNQSVQKYKTCPSNINAKLKYSVIKTNVVQNYTKMIITFLWLNMELKQTLFELDAVSVTGKVGVCVFVCVLLRACVGVNE